MPTYDYRCKACGDAFEHFQPISSPLLRKCTKCGKSALERLIGPGAGLLFKGSGFYITDYRSSSYQEAAKKDAAPTGSAPATPSASGDGARKAPEKSSEKSSEPAKPAPVKKPAAPA